MNDHVIRSTVTLSELCGDIFVASDVYLYRFDMTTFKCACFDKVEIRSPKYSKDYQAFFQVNNRKTSSIVSQIEGRVVILGGYARFWLREKDDAKALNIIIEAVTDDVNQHVDKLKRQIEKYENRLHNLSDIQIS